MEQKLKHLEFIQSVIARMDHNSFLIRGWVAALVSGLFALAAAQSNKDYVLITYVAIPSLWMLDAYYLHQERCFRCLYDAVIKITPDNIDFSMDCKTWNSGRNTWISSIFSKVLVAFYGSTIAITLTVMFLI